MRKVVRSSRWPICFIADPRMTSYERGTLSARPDHWFKVNQALTPQRFFDSEIRSVASYCCRTGLELLSGQDGEPDHRRVTLVAAVNKLFGNRSVTDPRWRAHESSQPRGASPRPPPRPPAPPAD